MAMTQAQALTQLREDRLDEPTEGRWSDAQLRRYINEGLREVSRRAEWKRKQGTVAVTANTGGPTSTLTAPTDIVRVFGSGVHWTPTADANQRVPLEWKDPAALDNYWGVRQGMPGVPAYWTSWGNPPTLAIQLYPVPSVAGSLNIKYYALATELATDGTAASTALDVPAGWEDIVIDWAEHRAWMFARETQLSNAALSHFGQSLDGVVQATTNHTDAPRSFEFQGDDNYWGVW